MTSTAPSTALTAAPPCPWWCTATPEAHEWSHDHFGGRIGLHHRNVGGFTLYATERIRPGGDSTVEIAAALNISVSTAHEHVENARKRFEAANRAELVAAAVSLGVIHF